MSKEDESYRERFDLGSLLCSLGLPPGTSLSCRGVRDLTHLESLSGRDFSEEEQNCRTSRRDALSLRFEPTALSSFY